MHQVSTEEAIALAEAKFYETLSANEIVDFQLFQRKLCMPFGVFHKNVEEMFKRPVYTHEFANQEALQKEYLGEAPAPTFEQIINMIPADKRILIVSAG